MKIRYDFLLCMKIFEKLGRMQEKKHPSFFFVIFLQHLGEYRVF